MYIDESVQEWAKGMLRHRDLVEYIDNQSRLQMMPMFMYPHLHEMSVEERIEIFKAFDVLNEQTFTMEPGECRWVAYIIDQSIINILKPFFEIILSGICDPHTGGMHYYDAPYIIKR